MRPFPKVSSKSTSKVILQTSGRPGLTLLSAFLMVAQATR